MSANANSSDLLKNAGSADLPITRNLTLAYISSSAIALIMAIAAVSGLLFRTTIYPTDELILSFLPVDLFHLVVGLPILLGSMWLARRGKLVGLLCWPGVLLYVLYSYVTNLIGVPFGALFLPYLLLVTLSAYTIVGLVTSIDGEAVRRRLAGAVPARTAGGILVGLTSLFIVIAVAQIATAAANRTPVDALDLMLWIADLTTIAPACLAGGILLWQRKALGYTGGAALLLAYSMLFIGLLPVILFLAVYNASPIQAADLVTMAAAGLVCVVLLALFVRGAAPDRSPRSIPEGDAGL